MDPIDQTVKTYKENFKKYIQRTSSEPDEELTGWMDEFASFLPEGAIILELGSASGRDAKYLRNKGLEVVCTDIMPEALPILKKDGFEVYIFDFRDEPRPEWINKFDGLFANAVLMHAPSDLFKEILTKISKVVKDKGIVAFSLILGEGEKMSLEKMDAPRYYKYYTKESLKEVLLEFKYEILNISISNLTESRSDRRWLFVTLRNHK